MYATARHRIYQKAEGARDCRRNGKAQNLPETQKALGHSQIRLRDGRGLRPTRQSCIRLPSSIYPRKAINRATLGNSSLSHRVFCRIWRSLVIGHLSSRAGLQILVKKYSCSLSSPTYHDEDRITPGKFANFLVFILSCVLCCRASMC
jgi:hypothetical protein